MINDSCMELATGKIAMVCRHALELKAGAIGRGATAVVTVDNADVEELSEGAATIVSIAATPSAV